MKTSTWVKAKAVLTRSSSPAPPPARATPRSIASGATVTNDRRSVFCLAAPAIERRARARRRRRARPRAAAAPRRRRPRGSSSQKNMPPPGTLPAAGARPLAAGARRAPPASRRAAPCSARGWSARARAGSRRLITSCTMRWLKPGVCRSAACLACSSLGMSARRRDHVAEPQARREHLGEEPR